MPRNPELAPIHLPPSPRLLQFLLALRHDSPPSGGTTLRSAETRRLLDAGLCLGSQGTYTLTARGHEVLDEVLRTLGDVVDGRAVRRPSWNRTHRELVVLDVVVKRFSKPAENQELLLDAFEAVGWPERVDDPLPSSLEILPCDRLRDTVRRLNASLDPAYIRFGQDGQGGACWRFLEPKLSH